jgi:hypothetical protein
MYTAATTKQVARAATGRTTTGTIYMDIILQKLQQYIDIIYATSAIIAKDATAAAWHSTAQMLCENVPCVPIISKNGECYTGVRGSPSARWRP